MYSIVFKKSWFLLADSAFEQEKVALESHYESKILNLEQELANLREASITEQNVTHSLQTGRQVTVSFKMSLVLIADSC